LSEGFDVADYWEQRAGLGYNEQQVDLFGRLVLKNAIERAKPESLCEIGCGTGMLIRYYKDLLKAAGCDFSPTMIQESLKRVKFHGWLVDIFLHDITKEPLPTTFDFVMTRTVLMHIPPDKIQAAVHNICDSCNSALIYEYSEETAPKDLSRHNWLHNYEALFLAEGFELIEKEVRGDIPQILFWFTRKKL